MKRITRTLAALLVTGLACQAETKVDVTKAAEPDGQVDIENIVGSIEVIGWERDEIHIEGTLGDDVEELEFDVSGDDARIEVKIPDRRRGRNREVSASLIIHVPQGSSLSVEGVTALITVRNIHGGEIDLESVSGKIQVSESSGSIQVENISAPIQISGSFGTVDAESVSGSIRISGATEEVSASTTSGKIDVVAGKLESIDLEALSGRISYEGGVTEDGEVKVESFSGAVVLVFTNDVFGDYRIETFSGQINNAYGPAPKRTGRFAPGKELNFDHGDGDASVEIESFSGSITFKRK